MTIGPPWREQRHNPFRLELPAVVAFSGGRTSGLMLYEVLHAFGGVQPPGLHVVFTNTGKERPETLDFIRECARAWDVRIVWLEYRNDPAADGAGHCFDVVDYATASRDGEPFEAMIAKKKMLPNRVARACTAELKVKTMRRWARSVGLDVEGYRKAVGLRRDEPDRVQRIRAGQGDRRCSEEIVLPLHEAGVRLADVMEFWQSQPFDLRLEQHEGNCDLCFLKRKGHVLRIMQERPDLAAWWIEQEERNGVTFRSPKDRPSYRRLFELSQQPTLFGPPSELDDTDGPDCACTD